VIHYLASRVSSFDYALRRAQDVLRMAALRSFHRSGSEATFDQLLGTGSQRSRLSVTSPAGLLFLFNAFGVVIQLSNSILP
jgi:hypothetical protein